jgi:hypothetical protein
MRNKKIDRALYGPTIYEVTFGLLLSVALGAALGITFLIFKPAEVVAQMPKEDERKPGTTYYVAGSADAVKGKQWMRKKQALIDSTPGEIAFTEDDFNLWSMSDSEAGKKATEKAAKAQAEAAAAKAAAPAKTPAKAPGKPAPAGAVAPTPEELPPAELVAPSVLNFRIRDGVVQVGLPTTINPLGYTFPVVAQASGHIEKQGDTFVFVPESVMIGSLPLNRIPYAVDYLMQRAMASDALPAEITAAWKKVKTVVVDGNAIKVSI